MNLTVERGRVKCDPAPKTLLEHKEKLLYCRAMDDQKTLNDEKQWLAKVHGMHIYKIINAWMAEDVRV
jgi:hypothetical protein